MPPSLDDILANRELEASVSIDWVKAELEKQPYNQYLQGLLKRKTNERGLVSGESIRAIIDSILNDDKMNTGDSYFIRDIELNEVTTFAVAEKKEKEEELKKNQITAAAIGAGAIVTGSIRSGAKEAAEHASLSEEPVSQTEQIEESGLLGFLNRLDGTIKRRNPTAALDPMLNSENYQKSETNLKEEEQIMAEDATKTDEIAEEVVIQEEVTEESHEEMEAVATTQKVKKKKKVKVKAGKGLRWSSMTPSDYKIKTLDPFTEWINKIDGVEVNPTVEVKKSKKGKKKKKKGMHMESLEQKPEIASEQLADLLVNQGHIQQAIEMYERLSLKYPEKSSFFAGKIEIIKDKL